MCALPIFATASRAINSKSDAGSSPAPGRPGRSAGNSRADCRVPSRPASLQPLEQLVDLGRVELLVVMPVDHHHRRATARSQALFLALEVDAAVGGGLAQLAAELLFGVRDQFLRAVEPAADVDRKSTRLNSSH